MLKSLGSKEELAVLKERFKRVREAKEIINDSRVSLGIDQKSGQAADLLAKQSLERAITEPLQKELKTVNESLATLKQHAAPATAVAPAVKKEEPEFDAEGEARREEYERKSQHLNEALMAKEGELDALWNLRAQVSAEELDHRAGEVAREIELYTQDAQAEGGLRVDVRILDSIRQKFGQMEAYIRDRMSRSVQSTPSRHEPDSTWEGSDHEVSFRTPRAVSTPARMKGTPGNITGTFPKFKGEGAPRNHRFKLGPDGGFGEVQVSLPDLASMKLRATRGGRVVLKKRVDPDFVDLVTKRFNPKRTYSPTAVELFRQLVKHSNLPMEREQTGKMQLLFPGSRGRGASLPMTVPEAVNRLAVLTGERDAGNTSAVLKNELASVVDFLVRQKKLSKRDAMAVYHSYVV